MPPKHPVWLDVSGHGLRGSWLGYTHVLVSDGNEFREKLFVLGGEGNNGRIRSCSAVGQSASVSTGQRWNARKGIFHNIVPIPRNVLWSIGASMPARVPSGRNDLGYRHTNSAQTKAGDENK